VPIYSLPGSNLNDTGTRSAFLKASVSPLDSFAFPGSLARLANPLDYSLKRSLKVGILEMWDERIPG